MLYKERIEEFYKKIKKFLALKDSNKGFVMIVTCLMLPIAMYCILVALNYAQMYSINVKIRKALLKSAFEVSKVIKITGNYSDTLSTDYVEVFNIANKAFVNAIGGQVQAMQGDPIIMQRCTLDTSKGVNNLVSSNISSSEVINESQMSFIASSALLKSIRISGNGDFEIKACKCDVGNVMTDNIMLNKWIFYIYPASQATGFEDPTFLDNRWVQSNSYVTSIKWNCLLDFVVPKGTFIINSSPFKIDYTDIEVPTKQYSRKAKIKLGYGSYLNLSDFNLVIGKKNNRIHIRVECPFTFIKTDINRQKNETVKVYREISVPRIHNAAIDMAIAVPLHKISSIKDKIANFIKRFNLNGVQISIIPYSSSVVAPETFRGNGWIRSRRLNYVPVKEVEIGDNYAIKFIINNQYFRNCARSFKYAKRILDRESCSEEDKEVCSKHQIIGDELLYYPSIKHYYMKAKNNSYKTGASKITTGDLFNSSNLIVLPDVELNVISKASTPEWLEIPDNSYLILNDVKINSYPIIISNSISYCTICGYPKFSGPCLHCGGGDDRIMSHFYSSGNYSNIANSDFIESGNSYDANEIAYKNMTTMLDNKSPAGCKLLKKEDGRLVYFKNIYIAINQNGIHILATEFPESGIENSGKAELFSNESGCNFWIINSSNGLSVISPSNNFINSDFYIYWNVNSFSTIGLDSSFNGKLEGVSSALKTKAFLKNIADNAKSIVFKGCNCSEVQIEREIRCMKNVPYVCVNQELNSDVIDKESFTELAYTTPKFYDIIGGCEAEMAELSQEELAKACLNGYIKYTMFYRIMDMLDIDKKYLVLNTSSSKMDGDLVVEISKVKGSIAYRLILEKISNFGIPENSFQLFINNELNDKYGGSSAKNKAYITRLSDGEPSKLLYPGLTVKDLYHSAGKKGIRDESLYQSNVPNTNKIMYPVSDDGTMDYDETLDTSIDGPPEMTFWALNNRPCIGTHGNLTNVGGWDYILSKDYNFSTATLTCRTAPEVLDTHSYEMRMLSQDIMDAAFYVSLMQDTNEGSCFQYLGLVWAARMINFKNVKMYANCPDGLVRDGEETKKVIVFIATKTDNFVEDELTSLGLSKDDGDALLNNSMKNSAIKEEDLRVGLTNKAKMVKDNIKKHMPECILYTISYQGGLSKAISSFEGLEDYEANDPEQLDDILHQIANNILADSSKSITIIE